MATHNFHKDFRLNGKNFVSVNDLLNHSREVSPHIFTFLVSWFNADDFVIVNTSGSTGVPKTIQLKKIHMVNSAMATGAYFKLPSKTAALLCLSTDYIAGKMMLVRAMTLGWYLDIVEPSLNPLMQNNKMYDFSAMVPLQVHNSLEKLSQIKKLIIGGGVVSKDLEVRLQEVSTQCYATYGMTETITHIAVKQLNSFDVIVSETKQSVTSQEEITSAARQHRNDLYQILPNMTISQDDRNCLVIDAPKVSDQLIVTNDVVNIISENEFIWLGRYDNIINSGGIKLIPEEIEDKLSMVIDYRFFVAGIPDDHFGEKLVIIIEGEHKKNVISNKLRNLKSLDKYEIPKETYFVKKFIETETKKIQRQQTLDLLFKK